MASDAEHLFVCLWASLYVLLGEVSVQVFSSFFNSVVCLPGEESCEFLIYFKDQTLNFLVYWVMLQPTEPPDQGLSILTLDAFALLDINYFEFIP